MSCKLSVITPVYNGVRFMESCIRSVVEQGCPEAEHIIMDGGSTDGTVEIIRRYAQKYGHIRFVSEKDKGQSDAMNKGIAMARGEVLSFLNVDDYYEPGALSDVVARFRELPVPTLLVGNCNIWDDADNLLGVSKPATLSMLNLLKLRYAQSFPMNPSAYFYHKSLHEKIGPYDIEEHFGMDVHFIFRALQSAHVKYVDRLWGNMRYFPGTKTFGDVESGQNRVRVTAITDYYRRQAPVHYRIYSSAYVTLVKIYKFFLKVIPGAARS
jgi:glycosyltransferase involved in cell wall biosynthesis